MQLVRYDMAEAAVKKLSTHQAKDYHRYFLEITPGTEEEIFRRGLFAFASVHTSWQSNVRLYEYLWDLKWLNSKRMLFTRIVDSRAGMYTGRTKHIWMFAKSFWENPQAYMIGADEDWFDYRDRLVDMVPGLGMAKAAFFSELVYLDESIVTCGDTHFHQLYGATGKAPLNKTNWKQAERHWADICLKHGIPPTTARWMFWDTKQRQPDSRYWSYVLEATPDKPPQVHETRQLELWGFNERMNWLAQNCVQLLEQ